MGVRGLDKGERAALVINECQNNMVNHEFAGNAGLAGEIQRRDVIANIAALATACRDGVGTIANSLLLGSLVKKGTVVEGSPGAEIHPELTPDERDFVLTRVHGLSPFHNTELEPVLRSWGATTVMITGVSTNVGVPGACLEAVNRGFDVVVPEDCTAGAWQEAHEFQVTHTLPLLATVTSSADVIKVLGSRSAA